MASISVAARGAVGSAGPADPGNPDPRDPRNQSALADPVDGDGRPLAYVKYPDSTAPLIGGTLEQPVPRFPADPEALAAESGLRSVNDVLPLRTYVAELWLRRHFMWSLAWFRYQSTSAQDRLGAFWDVLRPLLQAVVYTFIFTILIQSNSRPPNYPEYVTAGVFVFTFLSGTLISGASAIVGDLGIVRTLKFPRAVLPVCVALLSFIQFLPALVVLALLLLLFSSVPIGPAWLLVIPATALMTVFAAGISLFSARMTVIVRDYRNLLPFIMRIFFYLSGTVIDVSKLTAFRGHPVLGAMAANEPFYIYMDLVRNGFLTDTVAPAEKWIWGVAWAVIALVGGLIFFWRGERDYGS